MGPDACYQVSQPEFDAQDPHSRRREVTTRCPLISVCAWRMYVYTHTHTHTSQKEREREREKQRHVTQKILTTIFIGFSQNQLQGILAYTVFRFIRKNIKFSRKKKQRSLITLTETFRTIKKTKMQNEHSKSLRC